MWGILHPERARPFDYGFLSNLPFVRIAQWPIINGKIVAEWVIASPSGHAAYQFPIQLPKLRGKRAATT
jgi:hypothetical protein